MRHERGGAHLAGNALRANIKADWAADAAGVSDGDDLAVGALEEKEPDFDIARGAPGLVCDVDPEAVKLVVVDVSEGDSYLRADKGDGSGGGESGGALGVDEFGGGEIDKEDADRDEGGHPEALAAVAPLGFATFGRVCGSGDDRGGAVAALEQDHKADEGEHGDEEEEVIAHDWTDEAHLGFAGGKNAIFGELVQSTHDELEGDEVQDHRGDAEEALQVNANAAPNEKDAKDDGDGDAKQGAGEGEQLGGVEGDGGEDQDGFDALADNQQKDEEEESKLRDAGVTLCVAGDLGFNVTLHRTGGAVHEPDHAHDKSSGGQHDPAFDDVGVEVQVSHQDSNGDGGGDCSAESPKYRLFELGTANLAEVGKDDAYDEGGFDTLSEGDDKGS